MSHRLRQAWQRRGPLALALWPLTVPYRFLAGLRRMLYRNGMVQSKRLPVPVIVVGNVIAGGAGKTPVTLELVRHLRRTGWHPGVVSRGYGRKTQDCRPAQPNSLATEVGDEPLLIARSAGVPVFVAKRRAEAARALLAAHPQTDIIVCDDGLQHLALARDIEICVFNDTGIGNGFLLPAGPLREPWPRNVDWVLHTGPAPGGPAPHYALERSLATEAIDGHGKPTPLTALRGQALHALAGIARPEDFFAMLRAHGLTPEVEQALPDHVDFADWHSTGDNERTVLCTEKDAVKLWPQHPAVLAVPLTLTLPNAFLAALDRRLHLLKHSHKNHHGSETA